MERDWTGTGTEDGESPRRILRTRLCTFPIVLLPLAQNSSTPRKPALASETKQPPPSPTARPSKLPQHPVSQRQSSVGSLTSQGHTRFPFASGVSSLVVTHPPSASSSSLSLTSTRRVPPSPLISLSAAAVATKRPYPPPPRLRPLSARISAPRPLFHPFTSHNDLTYINVFPRILFGHNNLNAGIAVSEAAGINNARAV